MKRLFLVASLCVIGFVLVPIASSTAAPLTGSCVIHGTAKFAKALSPAVPEENKYEFTSEEPTECLNAETQKVEKATASVGAGLTGEGLLACPDAVGGFGPIPLLGESGKPANGTLTVNGVGHPFKLRFVALAANVVLDVLNEEQTTTATGDATFAENPKAVTECVEHKATSLKFTAVAAGKIG